MSDNNPVKLVYKTLVKDCHENENVKNWVSLFKDLLERNGFGYVWLQQGVQNQSTFISLFESRIKDIFIQNNHANILDLSEHRLYRFIEHEHVIADYLSNVIFLFRLYVCLYVCMYVCMSVGCSLTSRKL